MKDLLILCISLLTGLDCRISWTRWKKLGPNCELNPLVRHMIHEGGEHLGLATLLMSNLAILAMICRFTIPLAILLGAKIALAALQIKSLEYK